jgi:flagellar protein FlgJ
MAIQPPSDLILDVARNADSGLEAAATRRLEALAAAGGASGANFASALDQVAAAQQPKGKAASAALTVGAHSIKASAKSGDRAAQAAQEFEASLLGSFVNEMMPKEASAFYGQGVGGDIWKSMLADQIGHHLAKSGTLGLARRLFATHPIESLHGRSPSQGSSTDAAAPRAAQMSSQSLSLPFAAEQAAGGGNSARWRRS